MADICDRAQPAIEAELERHLKAAQRAPMPAGKPGECWLCGNHTPRLVEGACAPCREGPHFRPARLN